jgi:hypothetical protein
MNKEYVAGFMAKCAAAGVDPEELVKHSQMMYGYTQHYATRKDPATGKTIRVPVSGSGYRNKIKDLLGNKDNTEYINKVKGQSTFRRNLTALNPFKDKRYHATRDYLALKNKGFLRRKSARRPMRARNTRSMSGSGAFSVTDD